MNQRQVEFRRVAASRVKRHSRILPQACALTNRVLRSVISHCEVLTAVENQVREDDRDLVKSSP